MAEAPTLEIVTLEPKTKVDQRPLVFVHGAVHAAWCWEDHFLPYFRDHGYTSIAVSLRGHGGSSGKEKIRTTRIADYVADLASVVDGLDQPPILVGHSMGGFVIQKYLQSLGEASSTIPLAVLVSSIAPTGVIGLTGRTIVKHPLRFLKAIGTLKISPLFNTVRLFQEAFLSADMPLAEVQKNLSRMCEESFVAFLDFLVLDLVRPKKVKTPMVVIGGTRDVTITARETRGTARAYGTTAKIFDIAHDMMLEKNWEEVAEHIRGEIAATASPAL